jgi:hypothetical protein
VPVPTGLGRRRPAARRRRPGRDRSRLAVDTTTLVLVRENRWAAAPREAVTGAHGAVVAHDRVPRAVVLQAVAAAGQRPA